MGLIEGQRPFLRREAPLDDRGTQGQGKREGYSWEKTPLEWRDELEKVFGSKYEGTVVRLNDDRSETTLRAYRLTYVREGFWPRAGALANAESLNYHATQSGYRLWGSPVLVDQAGQQEETGKATSDFWLYFEEIPGIDVTLKRGEVKSPTFRSRRDNPIQRDSYGFPLDEGKPLHELVYEQVLSKEPKQERGREGEEQDIFAAGRGKSGFYRDAQQRRSEVPFEDASYQNPGQEEQRNRQSQEDASTARVKDASSQEQGELAEARVVLQAIVNTHEDTIDETIPLDHIAGLTTEQVRVAERRVAQKIISDARARRINYGVVIKDTPQGLLGLVHGGQLAKSEEMALHLNKGGSLVMINTYALDQPREGMERNYGFEDYRLGWKGANLGSLALHSEKGRQLDDIRFMWRGLRWMSANMLAWDNPNTIMPEDLDSKPW